MAYTINARALQVEQELRELYDQLGNYGGLVKFSYNMSLEELDVLLGKIRVLQTDIAIARADLSAMLAEAKKI